MKEITHAWLQYAKRDFEDAESLLQLKRHHGALFFYQQATEKILKAYIIEKGSDKVPFVHDIRYLLETANIQPADFTKNDLKELSLVYTRIRYPDMDNKYYSDKKVIKNLIQQFQLLYSWLRNQFKNK